jgi:transcription antitermination factor NusG
MHQSLHQHPIQDFSKSCIGRVVLAACPVGALVHQRSITSRWKNFACGLVAFAHTLPAHCSMWVQAAMAALSKYWTLAATHRDQEWRAAYHTERLGFNFYIPQIRKGFTGREFMFPGYLFIQLQAGWEVLCRQRGIRRLFLTDEQPWKIRNKDLEWFRRREDADGLVSLRSRFQTGDRVVVKQEGNAFDGFNGIFAGDTPERRCRVLLSMLGRYVPFVLEETYLEAA